MSLALGVYSKINEASDVYSDPITLANQLTVTKIVHTINYNDFTKLLQDLPKLVSSIALEGKCAYALIRYMKGGERKTCRMIMSSSKVVAVLCESAGKVSKGRPAYIDLINDAKVVSGRIELFVGEIDIDKLPPDLAEHVRKSLKEVFNPLDILLGRQLYYLKANSLIYEDGVFYTLLLEDGKMLKRGWVLKHDKQHYVNIFVDNFRKVMEALSASVEEVSKQASTKNIPERILAEIIPYREHLPRPEAMIFSKVVVDPYQYYEHPTVYVEETTATQRLIELYGKIPGPGVVGSIVTRAIGALSYMSLFNSVHIDLSPHNLLVNIQGSQVTDLTIAGSILFTKLDSEVFREIGDPSLLDPHLILSGKYTLGNAVYTISLIGVELLTGVPNKYRRLLSKILASQKWGLRETFAEEERDPNVAKLREAASEAVKMPVNEALSKLDEVVAELEKSLWDALASHKSPLLVQVLKKGLYLSPAKRYKSPIEMYLDLRGLTM